MSALDTVIRRLENELDERKQAFEAILSNAADNDREPNDAEKATLNELTNRMGAINEQLTSYDATEKVIGQFNTRAKELDTALSDRRNGVKDVEYRSAGAYLLDAYQASLGDRAAGQRLEVFHRVAAHQKTSDNLGIIPDPIVGPVVNFIDSARPIVSALGPRPMPGATWHRPKVTQSTATAVQGSAGAAADEKTELTSQKMTITRVTGNAITYGGYVNVSRQNIDFSSPDAMDVIVNDLAAQYAIDTEAATGTALDATVTTQSFDPSTAGGVAAGIWGAAAQVYTAVKGQGRLILAVAPDQLATFGPLFANVNPQNAFSGGLSAANFGQGVIGNISGIQVVMSAGLASGKAFVFSSAAIEVYEQRVGTLSVTEPSVLGTQVAYAGYFTPLTLAATGIIELVEESSS